MGNIMTKEIAFLIWLYDYELEQLYNDNPMIAAEIGGIREKYAEFFGINEMVKAYSPKED